MAPLPVDDLRRRSTVSVDDFACQPAQRRQPADEQRVGQRHLLGLLGAHWSKITRSYVSDCISRWKSGVPSDLGRRPSRPCRARRDALGRQAQLQRAVAGRHQQHARLLLLVEHGVRAVVEREPVAEIAAAASSRASSLPGADVAQVERRRRRRRRRGPSPRRRRAACRRAYSVDGRRLLGVAEVGDLHERLPLLGADCRCGGR